MKKISCILLIFLLFSGCTNAQSLNQTALVEAIGIDKAEAGFEITMQVYTPKGAGNSGIDTSKNNASIIVSQGETIAQAIDNATTVQSKKIFIGHNRLIIIGEELAKDGILNVFSYFDSSSKSRENAEVAVAKGTAKELVSTAIQQGILSAETIEKLILNGNENGFNYQTPYYLFSKGTYLYNGCAVLPLLEKAEAEEESKEGGESKSDTETTIPNISKIKVEKTAVFTDYKMVDILGVDTTRGLLFAGNQIDKTNVVAHHPQTTVSTQIYKSKTRITPSFNNDEITVTFDIKSRGAITESINNQKDYQLTQEVISDIEKQVENIIKNECTLAVKALVHKDKSDVLYLGDSILKSNKELWLKIKDDFYENLDKLIVKVEVDVDIDRIGLEIP